MSGRYLYCQNTSCGVYLGCSGADSCSICGWCAGRNMSSGSGWEQEDDEVCPECGTPGCQGHCAGDNMMGITE